MIKFKTGFYKLFLVLGLVSQLSAQNTSQPSYLSVYISVSVIDTTYYPSAENPERIEISKTIVAGQLTGQIMSFRLNQYLNNPKSRRDCTADTHCALFAASSELKNLDATMPKAEHYPIYVTQINETQEYKEVKNYRKWVVSATSNISGLSSVEGLFLEVKTYNAPEGMLQPLTPNYVIGLWGVGAGNGGFNQKAYGEGTKMIWDSYKETLVPVDGPFGIVIPKTIADPGHNVKENEIYDQILLDDYKKFDQYLLKPLGNFRIGKTAKRYTFDENYREWKQNVVVKIDISPSFDEPELAPLDPIGMAPLEPYVPEAFELAPLDPVGIAPLDPVTPEGTFELEPLEPVKK